MDSVEFLIRKPQIQSVTLTEVSSATAWRPEEVCSLTQECLHACMLFSFQLHAKQAQSRCTFMQDPGAAEAAEKKNGFLSLQLLLLIQHLT